VSVEITATGNLSPTATAVENPDRLVIDLPRVVVAKTRHITIGSEGIKAVRLGQNSANCIDAAVMYASLFENLGMDATVVIVPGHAYAGVRLAKDSGKFLFLDVALTGLTTFEAAVASAEKGMARYAPNSVKKVLIQQARDSGIYPMP